MPDDAIGWYTHISQASNELREEISKQKRHDENEQFMELIVAYKDIASLNRSLLNELIKSIHVGPIQRVDGVKRRKIRIEYRQFCYVEIFSMDELFGAWTDADRDEWKALDEALTEREAAVMAM